MTAAELIAALSDMPPETIVLVRDNLRYFHPQLVKVAGTEYGILPEQKRVALVAERAA